MPEEELGRLQQLLGQLQTLTQLTGLSPQEVEEEVAAAAASGGGRQSLLLPQPEPQGDGAEASAGHWDGRLQGEQASEGLWRDQVGGVACFPGAKIVLYFGASHRTRGHCPHCVRCASLPPASLRRGAAR